MRRRLILGWSCLVTACGAAQTGMPAEPSTGVEQQTTNAFDPASFQPEEWSLPAVMPDQLLAVGVLDAIDGQFAWHDSWLSPDGTEVLDDGVSPLATFIIVWPYEQSGREISVLFRAEGERVPTLPAQAEPGQAFTLVLPVEALDDRSLLISNGLIRAIVPVP